MRSRNRWLSPPSWRSPPTAARADDGLPKGTPELKSATALAFGPKGLLFVGDSQSAAIFAISTGDAKPAGDKAVDIERIDGKIAAVLGVSEKEVRINDVKVNPASGNIYLAVTRGTGRRTPALLKVSRDGSIEPLALKDVMFSEVKLPNPAMGKGAATAITSMAFLIAAVRRGAFERGFRQHTTGHSVPVQGRRQGDRDQFFHGAHGRLETQAAHPHLHALQN